LGTLPWNKIGAEFAGGLAVDVIFQFGFDWYAHPDWTWQQRGLSVAAQIPGSVFATAVGLSVEGLLSLAGFGLAGPAGLVVGFGAAIWFDHNVTPHIYKWLGFD
jgi:hypothetical protein